MSSSTWINGDERARLRQMRQEGKTIEEIVIASGRSKTAVHEVVRDMDVVIFLSCGWCDERFPHEPCRGRPPGYCSEEHRYEAALHRKREARGSVV